MVQNQSNNKTNKVYTLYTKHTNIKIQKLMYEQNQLKNHSNT